MSVKEFKVKIKAGADDGLNEGMFTAYASVFDNVDSYGDIVRRGAFTKTLEEWAGKDTFIPLLFGHRMDDPDFNIGHIVEAVEDEHGLLVTGQLDLESTKGAQVYRMLKGRRVDQLSFAYDVIAANDVKIDGENATELTELKLYEVSIVTIGANQATEVLAVKTAADALHENVKAGRVLAQKHIDSLRAAYDAIGAVLAAADTAEEPKSASETVTEVKDEACDGKSENVETVSPVEVSRRWVKIQALKML